MFSHARVMIIGVNDIDHTCFFFFFFFFFFFEGGGGVITLILAGSLGSYFKYSTWRPCAQNSFLGFWQVLMHKKAYVVPISNRHNVFNADPEGIFFSCSTQPNAIFQLLIKAKILTNKEVSSFALSLSAVVFFMLICVGILTFKSRIYFVLS